MAEFVVRGQIHVQADQARQALAAVTAAAREFEKAGPSVTQAWAGTAPVLGQAPAQAAFAWRQAATAVGTVAPAVAGVTRATREQSTAFVAAARETQAWRGALDDLRAEFNPLFAASREYEAQLVRIAEAERMGALSAVEAAAARDRAAAALAPMGQALGGVGGAMGAASANSANLAAQFNDIGVMALAMQNPLQLAIQQGSQVNQVFGAMGGHAQGIRGMGAALGQMLSPASLATIAVIGLGAAAIQWLAGAAAEAETLDETLQALDQSVEALRRASDLASPRGLDELARLYGGVTAEVERLAEAQERAAQRAQQNLLADMVAGFQALAAPRWSDFGISDEASGMLQLRSALQLISREETRFVYDALQRIGEATGPAEMADQLSALAAAFEALEGTTRGLSSEHGAFVAQLTEAAALARQIAAIDATRGRRDHGRAEALLEELAIQTAINRHGEDARVVTELRGAAERRAFDEMARGLDISEDLRAQLLGAWDNAKGLAAVDAAGNLARARAEASALADEIGRAAAASQGLLASGADALEDARIRAETADPVQQARRLAEARMRRVQAPLRRDAVGLGGAIDALDADVRRAGEQAAETERANAAARARNQTRSAGARAAGAERSAVDGLIASLQGEIDLLREADPVQQAMIRNRAVLAEATEADRQAIEALIAEQMRLSEAVARMDEIRALGRDVIGGIISGLREGASAGDILAGVLDRIADKLADMAASGLTDILFGRSGGTGGGFLGGLIGALFGGGGPRKNAMGAVVGAPTLFAYGNELGQLGVMGEAGPEAIMPLTHAAGAGVGALTRGGETTLPLARLASGKLGVDLSARAPVPFALGGAFGTVSTGAARAGAAAPVLRIEIVEGPMFASQVRAQAQASAVEIVRRDAPEIAARVSGQMAKVHDRSLGDRLRIAEGRPRFTG